MPSQDHVRDSYRIEGVGDGSTHMAFSHRVGRSLCMTMCTGFGLFLIPVGPSSCTGTSGRLRIPA
eukprot:COSAG06_NODE_29282_length_559_cov_1.036957_1_plen_64_part_10